MFHTFMPLEQASDGAAGGQPAQPDYKAMYEAQIAQATVEKQALVASHAAEKTEWDKRFGGLQATFQKEQDAHKAAMEQTATLKAQVDSLTGELTTVKTTGEQLLGKYSDLEKKAGALEGSYNRARLIMSDFPELAKFEANNLLPSADNETQLKERLTLFQTALGTVAEGARKSFAAGGTGDPNRKKDGDGSGSDGKVTSEVLRKQAQDAAVAGDIKGYNDLFGQYIALKGQEAAR